ncbi:hypothetical protein [Flavihumibacter sp. UBA7668]|uniref:hypothetical protein n=1 Tax=Flavihumibacter sp. UBA7668 TaxID=1946542 RepID=UPI0025C45BF0|nr:hypothetical protein [Flavihumibacter sp. UBA7668]
MSFDLFFYKKKKSLLTKEDITVYLDEQISREHEKASEWFYENPDTGVYFYFELSKPDLFNENPEESLPDFEDLHFSFNLNFMRPDFFGMEAFKFVQELITVFDLYILNPQGNAEVPIKESETSLFQSWLNGNKWASIDYFKEIKASYIHPGKSSKVWQYNYNKNKLQKELGDVYFVPTIFFLRKKENNEVITLSTWFQHIPTVIPPADFFLLGKEYKHWFKTVKESILVDYDTLIKTFDGDFEDYTPDGSKIIHPEIAEKIGNKFNRLRSSLHLESFAESIPMENLFNYRPEI